MNVAAEEGSLYAAAVEYAMDSCLVVAVVGVVAYADVADCDDYE